MSWRLVVSPALDGARQMALDEAMLEAVRLGHVPATLRFYRWERPTLSLGYAQKPESIDRAACAHAGVALCRRPTGGRAVLHWNDVTYAVAATGLPRGISAAYREIAAALGLGLSRLGLGTTLSPGQGRSERSAACFAATTPADLGAAGGKLIGSAQVRRDGAVLQHGTLYLRYPAVLAEAVLPGPAPEDLAGLLGEAPDWESVMAALTAGFEAHFEVPLVPGELTRWELERAEARIGNYQVLAACP